MVVNKAPTIVLTPKKRFVVKETGTRFGVESILDKYRKHWALLHLCETPTQEWFHNWIETIPKLGCGNCRAGIQDIIKKLPPRFDNWFPYTVDLHNEVNRQLKKPLLTYDEAFKIWFPVNS